MPPLSTKIHLDMYNHGVKALSFQSRLKKAFSILAGRGVIYGMEWGDPDHVAPLKYIRDRFLTPYLKPETTIAEIGTGGGRWTQYMLDSKHIYAIDYHKEILDGLKKAFRNVDKITYIVNNGDDFPGIPDHSIDFLFSFGTFVHLENDIIDRYLKNMVRVLKSDANVVLQFADKSKPMAANNPDFGDNQPETMAKLIRDNGFTIYDEDNKTLWHSGVVRFGLAPASD